MGRHGLVGWAKPIGRHGVPWKTQSTHVWLACSELVTSLSTSSTPSSVAGGEGHHLCRIAASHAAVGMLGCARYFRRTTSSIKLFPYFPEIGKFSCYHA